jgi:hypothetical protein
VPLQHAGMLIGTGPAAQWLLNRIMAKNLSGI